MSKKKKIKKTKSVSFKKEKIIYDSVETCNFSRSIRQTCSL